MKKLSVLFWAAILVVMSMGTSVAQAAIVTESKQVGVVGPCATPGCTDVSTVSFSQGAPLSFSFAETAGEWFTNSLFVLQSAALIGATKTSGDVVLNSLTGTVSGTTFFNAGTATLPAWTAAASPTAVYGPIAVNFHFLNPNPGAFAGGFTVVSDNTSPAPIPEPSTYVLLMAGLVALAFVAGRRDRAGRRSA